MSVLAHSAMSINLLGSVDHPRYQQEILVITHIMLHDKLCLLRVHNCEVINRVVASCRQNKNEHASDFSGVSDPGWGGIGRIEHASEPASMVARRESVWANDESLPVS